MEKISKIFQVKGGTVKIKGKKFKKIQEIYQHSLTSGIDMRAAVECPKGENENAWIAFNVVELYNTMNLVVSLITDNCTKVSCPTMSAGEGVTYLWADGKKIVKPVECSASEYIAYLQQWISETFEDTSVFPENDEQEYPKKFKSTVKKILERMFRVYAHVYHHHLEEIKKESAESHLFTCFKHFYYFVNHFKLVAVKDMVPLQSLIEKIEKK